MMQEDGTTQIFSCVEVGDQGALRVFRDFEGSIGDWLTEDFSAQGDALISSADFRSTVFLITLDQ